MKHCPHRLALALGLTLPALAQAAPFSIFEARGFAMGGAGVASSEQAAASFYNPALLAVKSDSDRFSFIAPGVGVRVSGNDGAVKAVMDFEDHKTIDKMTAAADRFTAQYDQCQANPGGCNTANLRSAAGGLADATSQLQSDLTALSGKTYNVNSGALLAVALPKWAYKGAFSVNAEFHGKATPYIDAQDLTDVNTVLVNARAYAAGNDAALANIVDSNGDVKVGSNNQDYNSNFKVVGAAIVDIGVSLARSVQLGEGSFLLGITPKIQQIQTVAYTADVDNTEFDLKQNKKTASGFNVDVGVAKTFEPGSEYERVRLGLVVRNLIPHTYKTADPTQDIKLAPQLRVGAAWTSKYGTVTSDLDLTANKVVGGSDSSQIFALGGEVSAWDVLKLRAGYRQDFKAKISALTAGFSLLGLQVSAAYSKDREVAAMAQFGASF